MMNMLNFFKRLYVRIELEREIAALKRSVDYERLRAEAWKRLYVEIKKASGPLP